MLNSSLIITSTSWFWQITVKNPWGVQFVPLTKICDEIKELRRQGSPFPGRLKTETYFDEVDLLWGVWYEESVEWSRHTYFKVWTPVTVHLNHAHARRGRLCTLSPGNITICPELKYGSNSKNAISYICFSMYFLADIAKVGFFLNLSVEVKIFCNWQELSKQCFRFASDSAYYIFTEMRSSPELIGLICPRIRSNLCAQSCNAWFHHTVLRMMKYAHSAHGISGTGSRDASGSLWFHP